MSTVVLSAVLNLVVCIHGDGVVHIVPSVAHENCGDGLPSSGFDSFESLHCVDISVEILEDFTLSDGHIECPKSEMGVIDFEWISLIRPKNDFCFIPPSKIPPDKIVRGNIYNSIVSRLLI